MFFYDQLVSEHGEQFTAEEAQYAVRRPFDPAQVQSCILHCLFVH
ncbi:Ltp family lipoprotein [Rossellomorea vietnamensis]